MPRPIPYALPKIFDKIEDLLAEGIFETWYDMDGNWGSLMVLMHAELGEMLEHQDQDTYNSIVRYWADALDGQEFIQYCIDRANDR